jgi:hypothetical protein
MMKGLQRLAADSRANPYARIIARALCLSAFGGFCEEQTHLFGVLAISTHNGRATMYCKTKRKAREAPTEYAIVPLSGVLDDNGAWIKGGEDLMTTLPGNTDFFLPGFDAPAGKRENDPYVAFRVLPAPMSQKQMDETIAHVLHSALGYEWEDARLFTRHSFRHFLPEIIQEAPSHCEHAALEQCNDAMRWAGSVLSDNPGLLSGADKHRDKYISSISDMTRNYSESAQVKRLRSMAQHHRSRSSRNCESRRCPPTLRRIRTRHAIIAESQPALKFRVNWPRPKCVFITAVPNTKLCAWGEEDSGGHVL